MSRSLHASPLHGLASLCHLSHQDAPPSQEALALAGLIQQSIADASHTATEEDLHKVSVCLGMLGSLEGLRQTLYPLSRQGTKLVLTKVDWNATLPSSGCLQVRASVLGYIIGVHELGISIGSARLEEISTSLANQRLDSKFAFIEHAHVF